MQVCDGLKGVDAAHLQDRTPGCEVVLQLSRAEEGRVKHGDVPSSRSTCGASQDLLPMYFTRMPAFRFIPVSQAHVKCTTISYTSNSLAQASETPPWPTCAPPCSWSCASGAAASPRRIWQVRQRRWGRSSCFLRQSTAANSPRTPWLVPCTGIFLGPSKSGKTVALISMILEQYRGVFEKIYIFSPSINIDDGWIPVKKYIEEDLGVNTEREQAYYDEWDEAALRGIIQRQRKITETSKKLEMKKLYQVLIICDDFADSPQLHKAHSALDTLFIRGRHLQISTWVSSQKLRLISAAVRVNQQFLCCWRLRNQHELEAVIEELSALLPKDKLHRIYEQATREPYSFLFVYYLKPKNEMFYLRFEERFALEKEADGSGAQLPGSEAVR